MPTIIRCKEEPRDIFKNVDFNDAQLLADRDCREGMCQIGRQLMRRNINAVIDAWHQANGDLLQVEDREIRFFGGHFRLTVADDGSVALVQTTANGQVHDVSNLSLTLEALPNVLRASADQLVDRLQYEEICRITGLPMDIVSQHTSLYTYPYFRNTLMERLADYKQLNQLVAQAMEEVRRRINRDGLRMARKCKSDEATVATYNFCMKHQAMVQQLMREAQQLLPLVYSAYAAGDLTSVDCNTLKTLKTAMVAKGMPEAGWKLLAHMPVGDLRWLTNKYAFAKLVEIADFVAKSQVMPPMPLLRRWLDDMYSRYRKTIPPTWLRRAAAIEANTKANWPEMKQFINGEYANVLDWVRANPVQPDANQLRAGWKWIQRQSDEWHQRTSQRHVHRHLAWQSLVEEYTEGDYKVVPLVSSAALVEEGQKMHHCVGSYDHQCVSGYSRIFSFRDPATDKPVATAEIRLTGTGWQLSQVRGPCNAMVDQSVQNGVAALLRKYNRAHAALMAADADSDK